MTPEVTYGNSELQDWCTFILLCTGWFQSYELEAIGFPRESYANKCRQYLARRAERLNVLTTQHPTVAIATVNHIVSTKRRFSRRDSDNKRRLAAEAKRKQPMFTLSEIAKFKGFD